jgi:hypothetical protein
MKIAINICYGGFTLSQEAGKMLRELGIRVTLKGEKYPNSNDISIHEELKLHNENFQLLKDNIHHDSWRADERLIKVIETLGSKASGRFSKLKIVEIPDDVEWTIDEYDGMETIDEVHRSWG